MFKSDRYDDNLASMMAQGVTAIVRGTTFRVSAAMVDGAGDAVDVGKAFVDRVEANPAPGSPCAGLSASDTNGDGVLDTFGSALPNSTACFRVVPRANTSVPAVSTAQKFEGRVQLLGDGLASMTSVDVTFVVPRAGQPGGCTQPDGGPLR